jgi:hypothetical protein
MPVAGPGDARTLVGRGMGFGVTGSPYRRVGPGPVIQIGPSAEIRDVSGAGLASVRAGQRVSAAAYPLGSVRGPSAGLVLALARLDALTPGGPDRGAAASPGRERSARTAPCRPSAISPRKSAPPWGRTSASSSSRPGGRPRRPRRRRARGCGSCPSARSRRRRLALRHRDPDPGLLGNGADFPVDARRPARTVPHCRPPRGTTPRPPPPAPIPVCASSGDGPVKVAGPPRNRDSKSDGPPLPRGEGHPFNSPMPCVGHLCVRPPMHISHPDFPPSILHDGHVRDRRAPNGAAGRGRPRANRRLPADRAAGGRGHGPRVPGSGSVRGPRRGEGRPRALRPPPGPPRPPLKSDRSGRGGAECRPVVPGHRDRAPVVGDPGTFAHEAAEGGRLRLGRPCSDAGGAARVRPPHGRPLWRRDRNLESSRSLSVAAVRFTVSGQSASPGKLTRLT